LSICCATGASTTGTAASSTAAAAAVCHVEEADHQILKLSAELMRSRGKRVSGRECLSSLAAHLVWDWRLIVWWGLWRGEHGVGWSLGLIAAANA
jgi:hypothetical protein